VLQGAITANECDGNMYRRVSCDVNQTLRMASTRACTLRWLQAVLPVIQGWIHFSGETFIEANLYKAPSSLSPSPKWHEKVYNCALYCRSSVISRVETLALGPNDAET